MSTKAIDDPTLKPLGAESDDATPQGDDDSAAAALRLDMLGGGFDGAEPSRPKINQQNVLLLLVVLGGGAALLAMRAIGMGPASSIAENIKIDYPIDAPKSGPAKDHLRVLADLSATQATNQVPPDQVQRNPFKMTGDLASRPPTTTTAAPVAAVDPKLREAEDRRRRIEDEFETLSLNSVVGGSTPLARVSGNTVRVGDTIGEFFTVTEIHGRGVVLEADGKQFHLHMVEGKSVGPTQAPSRRTPPGPPIPRR